MTPIEVMAKAAWVNAGGSKRWEDLSERARMLHESDMRAALLALAGEFEDPVVKKAILWAADEGKRCR